LNNKTEKVKDSFAQQNFTCSVRNNPQLRKACSDLESLFISYLLKEMRATIPKSGFISGGRAEEIYTSMLDSELAKELSSKGGIGLSSVLLHQLERKTDTIKE
jgi:flagellar protein FlgJ